MCAQEKSRFSVTRPCEKDQQKVHRHIKPREGGARGKKTPLPKDERVGVRGAMFARDAGDAMMRRVIVRSRISWGRRAPLLSIK